MIHSIYLKNFVLFEEEKIFFQKGLNIITGETGSGKSAILSALSLLFGEKADTTLIRQGEEKACVEATFHPGHLLSLEALCKKEDLDLVLPLSIRREICTSGKSRSFLCDQLISLSTLKEIGKILGEIIDQNTHSSLFSLPYQEHLFDLFADVVDIKKEFSKTWEEHLHLAKEITESSQKLEQKQLYLLQIEEKIQEIENAQLQKDEEKNLQDEFLRLSNMHEMQEKIDLLYNSFFQENSLLFTLQKNIQLLQSLLSLDPSLQETLDLLSSAQIELTEVSHNLRNYKGKLQENPHRLQEIEDRLSQIFKLKKKYGNSIEDIQASVQIAHTEKEFFTLLKEGIIEKKEKQEKLKIQLQEASRVLSHKRKEKIKLFEKQMNQALSSVNLHNALFNVSIEKKECTPTGEDQIEFLFSANNESPLPLEKCASGGEISRLLLLIKTMLADKEGAFSLVFDEIDANVGGESASLIGEKLKKIGTSRQVLCITHFVQVAYLADHHIRVSKKETSGKMQSSVEVLSKEKRKEEYSRMLGHFLKKP
ncbi:MAG: AAA family ATPase [Chlamydiota bacterium]